MAEVDLIYKITILNLLAKADYPLTAQQITDFLVDNKYTDYFTVHKNFGELLSDSMIENASGDPDAYVISPEGANTLHLLSDRITPSIEEDTRQYFKTRGMNMKRDNSLYANYDGVISGGYEVRLRMSENERNIMDLALHVMSRDQAEAICMNWRVKYDEVYELLMDKLM